MTTKYREYQNLLSKFVGFKSISTDPKYVGEIGKTALWLKELFKKNSFSVKLLKSKSANPVVFARYNITNNSQTVLIYGHYDVQPADKSDGWNSDPFKLTESKNRLFGRGVVDNKGQILIHIFTAINLIKQGKLNYNIKFLIEGNEETGNTTLSNIIKKYKKEMACNFVLVSDGELTNNNPTIETSLRGGFNCTLVYKTAKNNVHSGIFGGAIPNASHELIKFLDKIYNSDNSVSIKDFYKNVDKISHDEFKNNIKLISEAGNICKLAGVKKLLTEKKYDFFTQTGLRPTIQITGLKSGYITEGYSNIVPNEAMAKINFRIVASQKAKQIAKLFEMFVKENTPDYVGYKLSFSGLHDPVKVSLNNDYVKEAEKILENIYGKKTSRKNVGGAIPFVGDVKSILGVDTLLVPLSNEDCNMHGANENFDIKLIEKGLEFSKRLLQKH